VWTFLAHGIVDVPGLAMTLFNTARLAVGRLRGDWEHALFPDSEGSARRRMSAWAAGTLAGHAAIVAVSAATGLWQLAAVTTFAKFVAPWLHLLCNHTQHTGLRDNVPDFRRCARSVRLNPVLSFLYFRMNWHIEHHLYAAVPCYNLARLRRTIEAGMPRAPRGLFEAWHGIAAVLRRQRLEPSYREEAALPASSWAAAERAE
jgi:fatty acid desaturase